MSWLAVLLSLASLGGNPAPGEVKKLCAASKQAAKQAPQCRRASKPKPKKKPVAKVKPRKSPSTNRPNSPTSPRDEAPAKKPEDPDATPTPSPGATATPTPTPTPPPVYPSRTNVDLTDIQEWSIRPSYRILRAGPIDFNTNNLGEDDHNLSVRGGGHEYGRLDLRPGDSETLTLTLAAGPYTLYCSLEGHEDAGMRADISVR